MSFSVYKINRSGPPIRATLTPSPKDETAAVASARSILKREDCVATIVTHDGVPTVGLHSTLPPPPR